MTLKVSPKFIYQIISVNIFVLVPAGLKNLKIIPQVTEFEEIDISKALTTPGRLLYPKVAKRSRLDEFLTRRTHLKLLEERRITQQTKTEEPPPKANEEENVEIENEEVDVEVENSLDKQLTNMMSGKVSTASNVMQTLNREVLNSIAKKIQSLRLQYTSISKFGKDFQCYSKGCNTNSSNLNISCYSPLCLQRNKVMRFFIIVFIWVYLD